VAIEIAYVTSDAPTSTGSFTIAHGTATFTAKAAEFWITKSTVLGTAAADAVVGYGFCSASQNHSLTAGFAEDGNASVESNGSTRSSEAVALILATGTGSDGEANWVNFNLSGGKTAVTLNCANAWAAGYKIRTKFWGGSDLSVAQEDRVPIVTSTDETLSFDPDLIITLVGNSTFKVSAGGAANGAFSVGYAWDITGTPKNIGVCYRADDGATEQITRGATTAAACGGLCSFGSDTISGTLLIDAHSSGTGFSYQNVSDLIPEMAYLALNFGSADFVVDGGITDTPTTAITKSISGLACDPDDAQLITTFFTANDTVSNDSKSGAMGITSAHSDGTWTMSWATEAAAATMNSQCELTTGLEVPEHDGTAGYVASGVTLGTAKVDIAYTTVTGTAEKLLYLVTGPAAAGGTTYNVSATESLSFSEASSETATFVEIATDPLVLTDTSSETASLGVTLSESIAFTEASSELATFVKTIAEALVLTDTTDADTAVLQAIAESFVVTDTASEVAVFAHAVIEAIDLADTAAIATKTIGKILVEALTLTDTAEGTTGISVTATDPIVVTDTATSTATYVRSIIESVVFADATAIDTKTIGKTLAEALILTDTAAAEGGVAAATQRGGSSLTLEQMRRLERLQVIRRDDEEIINLLMGLMK